MRLLLILIISFCVPRIFSYCQTSCVFTYRACFQTARNIFAYEPRVFLKRRKHCVLMYWACSWTVRKTVCYVTNVSLNRQKHCVFTYQACSWIVSSTSWPRSSSFWNDAYAHTEPGPPESDPLCISVTYVLQPPDSLCTYVLCLFVHHQKHCVPA